MPMLPPELVPQLQGRNIPRGGFVRIPVSGPGIGTKETGGQFVPQSEAFWNAIKWKLPLGPAYSERPTTGTWGTDPGKQLLKLVPGIGRPLAAQAYAGENPIQWNPVMGGGERIWEVFKNLLNYGGFFSKPALMLSRGIDVAQGVTELFRDHPDRTGVAARTMQELPTASMAWTPQPLPQEPFQRVQPTMFSPLAPIPSYAPIPPGVIPSWGGEPGGEGWGTVPSSPTDFGAPWGAWRPGAQEFQSP